MIRVVKSFLILLLLSGAVFSQTDLERLVATERAFAKKAADTNTRQAFLEFSSADAVVFNPTKMDAKAFWEKREVSPALLTWYPVWADVNAKGNFGYTTGPWEFRPKGKGDKPAAFGQYVTLWLKQPDGNFKFVLDIGISFEKPAADPATDPAGDMEIRYPVSGAKPGTPEKDPPAGNVSATIMSSALGRSAKTYGAFLSDDSILLIDRRPVAYGKKQVLATFAEEDRLIKPHPTDEIKFSMMKYSTHGDLSYVHGEYSVTVQGKLKKNRNFMQIWKFRDKKWKLVLQVLNDIPDK